MKIKRVLMGRRTVLLAAGPAALTAALFFALLAAVVIALLVSSIAAGPLWGAVPRFGVDQQNSRRITDSLAETGFPFQKAWQTYLGGEVESQPIVCGGRIYVQAGSRLLRLDMQGGIKAQSPVLSESPMASGSSPTYAHTVFGERLYQATRDHRIWALDPDTLEPLWPEDYLILSAGGRPELHYRVTASPLVVNHRGRTLLALGTANGDQTDRPGQYADNGFFLLEDRGTEGQVVYCRQTQGEVTGSPLLMGDLIVATQNIAGSEGGEDNLLICYDLAAEREWENCPRTPRGIPGSPAAEGSRLYLADRRGYMYCYDSSGGRGFQLLWQKEPPGKGGSYNLNSPTLGSQYVYLPIRQQEGKGGLLAAYDKESGQAALTLAFDSQLCSNVVYWQPADSDREFLLVYEASGLTRLLDAGTLQPASGFMDQEGRLLKENKLPHAPAGIKAPEPIIGENYLLLADGAGVLHAYLGKGRELERTADLAITEFLAPSPVLPGEKGLWQAKVANLGEEAVEQARVCWAQDGRILHRQNLDIPGKTSVEIAFDWPGAAGPGSVRGEVWVEPPELLFDIDESNNRRWSYIQVGNPRSKVNCGQTKERGDWTVTYAVLAGYQTRSRTTCHTTAEGTSCSTSSYTDYNSPIYNYVEVPYQESLSAHITLYTGQGRLPDPARPAPEDQESRGAWEIIPYARKKGWDPNQVTRAGAGFTFQVETVYQTDWETKIPAKAEAIGGVLTGPDKVTAELYDTRGTLVKTVALQKTQDYQKTGRSLWQLPLAEHTYQDGTLSRKPWFYTAPDIPDGEFQILVKAEGAGLHGLRLCKAAKVRIYGSIYDDIYERLVP